MNKILNRTGMSLLEIMVAFSILVLVFIALTQALPMAAGINKTAENASKASYLAQQKLEELNSLGFDGAGAGAVEIKRRLSDNQENYLYYFQRQTDIVYLDDNFNQSAAETDLKKITITVYYANALSKSEKTYIIDALMARW